MVEGGMNLGGRAVAIWRISVLQKLGRGTFHLQHKLSFFLPEEYI